MIFLFKKRVFRNVTRSNNFSKVSLHFTRMANSSRKILRKNMHFLCDAIDFQKQLVESTLKVLGKSLKTVLDEVHFIVNSYSSPLHLVLQVNPSFPKVSYQPPSQVEQLSKLPPPLEILAISLVDIFSLNLSYSQANQKNSMMRGGKKIELSEATTFYRQKKQLKSSRIFMKLS